MLHSTLFVEQPSWEEDPRFAPLYRFKPTAAGKKSKATGKNSHSKAVEDLAEQGKPAKALTGSNLKLHDHKVTVDPPASFGRLSMKMNAEHSDKGKTDDPMSPLTSETSTSPVPSDQEDENEGSDGDEDKGDKFDGAGKVVKTQVVVNFRHPWDQHPSRAVVVPDASVRMFKTPGGTPAQEVLLSQLVPAALQMNSPMKGERGGRLARPGFIPGHDTYPIGSVAQHLDGPPPQPLNLYRANALTLTDVGGGLFGCDLFYEPGVTNVATLTSNTVPPANLAAATGEAAAPTDPALTATPTSLTGAGTDLPLEIAQARAAQMPPPVTAQLSTPQFNQFLRACVGQERPLPITNNTTALDGITSFLNFDTFLKKFSVFSKKGGGYIIPPDWVAPAEVINAIPVWQVYRNKTFTQREIVAAAGLKPSATKANHGGYGKALKLKTELGDWLRMRIRQKRNKEEIDEDDDEEGFDGMGYGAFLDLIDEQVEEADAEKPGPSKPKAAASSSKHHKRVRAVEGSDNDDDAKAAKKKRRAEKEKTKEKGAKHLKKNKGKAKEDNSALDSSDLDK
ncbi:hypothetical protein B0H11DRAFT_1934636 [Mycena galericulata]|nr:hypothetical protein B0H11DRAFT_1934636 [Mycena galericulata]